MHFEFPFQCWCAEGRATALQFVVLALTVTLKHVGHKVCGAQVVAERISCCADISVCVDRHPLPTLPPRNGYQPYHNQCNDLVSICVYVCVVVRDVSCCGGLQISDPETLRHARLGKPSPLEQCISDGGT